MIYLSDHLDSEDLSLSSSNSVYSQTEKTDKCEFLHFPSVSDESVSREEIGKWVDKLMKMPDDTDINFDETDFSISNFTDPLTEVAEKILSIGGKIFWFSSEEIETDIPKIVYGEFPKGNSGLAAIAIASYLNTKLICLSGIKLTGQYEQFIPGKNKVFLRRV